MSRVTYVSLESGGFLATSADRPDVYLTWLTPDRETCSLNVRAYYRCNEWKPVAIGRLLDWHAFQVQAETLLGVSEHMLDAQEAPPHKIIYNSTVTRARCTCGHWALAVSFRPVGGTEVPDIRAVNVAYSAHAA